MMEGHLYIRKTKTACIIGHSELSEAPGMAGCFGKKFILMEVSSYWKLVSGKNISFFFGYVLPE